MTALASSAPVSRARTCGLILARVSAVRVRTGTTMNPIPARISSAGNLPWMSVGAMPSNAAASRRATRAPARGVGGRIQ